MTLLSELNPNARNPRTVTPEKLEQLKKTIEAFGDLSGFVYNQKTKQLVSGHQRQKVIGDDAKIVIEHTFKKPTDQGTVATGYVLINGERFSYREVVWTSAKENAANLAANRGAGEWDYDALGDIFKELKDEDFDLDLTMFDENQISSLMGDWDSDIERVNKVDESGEAAAGVIKIKCLPEDRQAVYDRVKESLADFEGVDVS